MILQSLVAYYETLARQGAIAKPGWGDYKISYAESAGRSHRNPILRKRSDAGKKEGIRAYGPYAAGRREKIIGYPAAVPVGQCRLLPGAA